MLPPAPEEHSNRQAGHDKDTLTVANRQWHITGLIGILLLTLTHEGIQNIKLLYSHKQDQRLYTRHHSIAHTLT